MAKSDPKPARTPAKKKPAARKPATRAPRPKKGQPAGLGLHARKFWEEVTSSYELRPDEMRTLNDACREIDLIETMRRKVTASTLTVQGSMGQPVANPLLQELRQHRGLLQRMLSSLKLPNDPGESGPAASGDPAAARSTAARKAANARWRRGA